MALAAWKRIEKSPGYQRVKTSLKRLVGKELPLRVEYRVRTEKDGGWWFAPEGLDQNSIVYSLGVGEDIEFDLSIIDRFRVELHAFDPTPSSIHMLKTADLPEQFHFHPWAITAEDGTLRFYPRVRRDGSKSDVMFTMIAEDGSVNDGIDVPAFCLSSVTNKLGHDHVDLLKMDIEGAEYEVLEGLLASQIKPRQLLVEFHHRFAAIGLQKTAGMVTRLRDAGYKIFAVSETGREVSFLLAD
jgi:FkbM family methyltransferase